MRLLAVAIYAVLASVLSLSVFGYANFSDDWREVPSIENISVEKGSVGVNDVVGLQADVKNLNSTKFDYLWRADVGELLDNEGSKVTWKAPGNSGIAEIELRIVAANSSGVAVVDQRAIRIEVKKSSAPSIQAESGDNFAPRCTKALEQAYKGKLHKAPKAYEAAAIICSSAGRADDGSADLTDKYLSEQAKTMSDVIPMDQLSLAVANASLKRRSFWDKRPCCNESNLLWPFCKVFSKECEERP